MQLFGTDGIRGIAGKELTPKLAFLCGVAVAKVLGGVHKTGHVVVGKDTRISSDMIESNVISGLCYGGTNVIEVGVVPAPAISYLCKKYAAFAGVMITASHNSPQFNGIKIFCGNGEKLDQENEAKLEKFVFERHKYVCPPTFGRVMHEKTAYLDYCEFVESALSFDLSGVRVGLDLCHGTLCDLAERVFENLGAEVRCENHSPEGELVNVCCGSEFPDRFAGSVARCAEDVGFAFDCDGDRVVVVDEKGSVVDGDKILFLFASHLKNESRLVKNAVVGTSLSSLALEEAFEKRGISLLRADVGEKSVLQFMNSFGLMLGAEPCGKVILREFLPTADGLLAALFVAKIVKETKKPLSKLVESVKNLPKKEKNYILETDAKQSALVGLFDFVRSIAAARKDYRVLIRQSGTENAVRVCVEGVDKKQVDKIVAQIDDFVLHMG